jgi:hypothetical protein
LKLFYFFYCVFVREKLKQFRNIIVQYLIGLKTIEKYWVLNIDFLLLSPGFLNKNDEKLVKFGFTLLPVWHFMESDLDVFSYSDEARSTDQVNFCVVICIYWFN